MEKKRAPKKPKQQYAFSLGDYVEILHFGFGKIIELRGALGPKGAQVYRVVYQRKPRPAYIEVLANQMRPAKPPKRAKPTVEVQPQN